VLFSDRTVNINLEFKMGSKRYYQYMKSSAWRIKRQVALDFHGRKCSDCGSTYDLQVHHLNYSNMGNETMNDLQILCESCHMFLHYGTKPKVRKTKKKKKKVSKTSRKKAWDTIRWNEENFDDFVKLYFSSGKDATIGEYGKDRSKKMIRSKAFKKYWKSYTTTHNSF